MPVFSYLVMYWVIGLKMQIVCRVQVCTSLAENSTALDYLLIVK